MLPLPPGGEPCAGQIEIFRHLDRERRQITCCIAMRLDMKKGDILFSPETILSRIFIVVCSKGLLR